MKDQGRRRWAKWARRVEPHVDGAAGLTGKATRVILAWTLTLGLSYQVATGKSVVKSLTGSEASQLLEELTP